MQLNQRNRLPESETIAPRLLAIFLIFFLSGFTALLYQVVWQRMLGLFSGSDVRSVTIVVAAYLLGLGLGSAFGGFLSDRLRNHQAVQLYGLCNLAIALFAISSRFLFYDLLFRQLQFLAQSAALTLLIIFISLLIPTVLMGVSLPLLARASSRTVDRAAIRIGWLYGVNTLGSGIGTFISGWYIIGTLGYEKTVYLGAVLNVLIGVIALTIAPVFSRDSFSAPESPTHSHPKQAVISSSVLEWCCLVFFSGFSAISLEILWFRILETVLQSNAYTYAHLLAFILISNALGSLVGAGLVRSIQHPRRVFLGIQGIVVGYSAIAIWLISLYWQAHPIDLRSDIGYLDLSHLNGAIGLRYLVLPLLMLVLPNFLLGFYVPLVQKAVQTDRQQIGQRVGLIQVANILGNTTGSLLTGLVLLDVLGTAGALRLLILLGAGLVLLIQPLRTGRIAVIGLAVGLVLLASLFPSNTRLWAALHGVPPDRYFIAAEDSTGVAAITETNHQGTLLASGQAQANFPYLLVHALLGTLPALMHSQPSEMMIIGLGSGGTAHTAGANPLTRHVTVVELLGAELSVLHSYAQTPVGQPLSALFHDPRYTFVTGDGRQQLSLTAQKFNIIEADAIYPWRSRAGMLYSQEFFQAVQSHLAPDGFFVEWNVGKKTAQTFRSVFANVTQLDLSGQLSVLIGSDRPVSFDRQAILAQLNRPAVLQFLSAAQVDVAAIRREVKTAKVYTYTQAKDGRPQPANTDLFPRSEYYLNQ